MPQYGLRGKVALVTGANHGIGAAIARGLAAEGCRVALQYLRIDTLASATDPYHSARRGSAETVAEEIRSLGGEAVAVEADLADPSGIGPLIDKIERNLGPLEILVNNAAHWEADTFVPAGTTNGHGHWPPAACRITPETHDRHFAVNTRAMALLMAEMAGRHAERGSSWGRIVNVSTDGAYCFPSEISYGASKAAGEAYSRSAAAELGKYGITVNIVSPGPIQTGWITEEHAAALSRDTPLGRVGTPEEVADVVVFLASHQARWLTGQLLHVGGGHAM